MKKEGDKENAGSASNQGFKKVQIEEDDEEDDEPVVVNETTKKVEVLADTNIKSTDRP